MYDKSMTKRIVSSTVLFSVVGLVLVLSGCGQSPLGERSASTNGIFQGWPDPLAEQPVQDFTRPEHTLDELVAKRQAVEQIIEETIGMLEGATKIESPLILESEG